MNACVGGPGLTQIPGPAVCRACIEGSSSWELQSSIHMRARACRILRCHAGRVRYLLGMPQPAAPSGAPSAGVGVLTLLARGSVASVNSFHHDARPVRDPAEEWFSGDTLIFTVGGSWRIRSRHGWVDANPDLLVFGRAGTPYRCDHGRGVPTDRNLAVMLHPGALAPIVGVDTDPLSAALLEQPIPDLPSLPVTAELALTARRLAVESATIPALPGRSLRIDCLVVDLLVQLHRASGRYAAIPLRTERTAAPRRRPPRDDRRDHHCDRPPCRVRQRQPLRQRFQRSYRRHPRPVPRRAAAHVTLSPRSPSACVPRNSGVLETGSGHHRR